MHANESGELTCADCDVNARCERSGDALCVCNPGYVGDGFTCKVEGEYL